MVRALLCEVSDWVHNKTWIMRKIGIILIIDFFSRRRNVLSSTFESSIIFILQSWIKSNLLWRYPQYVKSCDKNELLHFHPPLGFEDVHCKARAKLSPHSSPTRRSSPRSGLTPHTRSSSRPWSSGPKGDNYDMALSFKERAGCDEICAVQGKDDRGFGVISVSAASFDLLVADLVKLEKSVLMSLQTSPEGEAGYLLEKVLTKMLCHKSMK